MPASASSRPTSPLRVIDAAPDHAPQGYVPGVCNIGAWEIRRRRSMGIVGIAAAGALLVALVAIGAPPLARALVLLPAWGGAFSLLQARRRFCGAYAMRRVSNFTDSLTGVRDVADQAAHRADLLAVVRLARDSFLVGLAIAAIAVLLPL